MYTKARLGLCVLIAAACPCVALAKPAGQSWPTPHVALMRFAVAGEPSAHADTPSARACPAAAPAPGTVVRLDPQVLDAVTQSLRFRLSKTMSVTVVTDVRAVPPGAVVVAGCITRADPGDGAKRMIGAFLGASHLDAHVQLLSRRTEGLAPLKAFDVKARGGNLLPPLSPVGLAMRTATLAGTSLKANAPKLAFQTSRKVFATVFPGREDDDSLDDDD